MRKRIMAFFMALLMIFTILPGNFIIVEANDTNGALYLKVTGTEDWEKAEDIKVTVKDSSGKEIDSEAIKTELVAAPTDHENPDSGNIDSGNTDSGNTDSGNTDSGDNGPDNGADTDNSDSQGGQDQSGNGSDESDLPSTQANNQQVSHNSITIAVMGLKENSEYTVDITSDGKLSWKKALRAVALSDAPSYKEVAMVKDEYTDFAFSTDFSNWKKNSNPTLSVEGVSISDTDTKSIKYASLNTDVATVDEITGAVTITKAGTAAFTATLVDGDNYKTIESGDVVISKLDQTLTFTDVPTQAYVGEEITAAAVSNATDATETITYSVESGEAYIETADDFANTGKWKAKSYGDSDDGVNVTIKATISEDDKYVSATQTYTTKIIPYPYDDFRNYCDIEGTSNTASDGTIWYSEVTGIEAKDGYQIKADGKLKDKIAIDDKSISQGDNSQTLVITDKNGKNEGKVTVSFKYDNVNPKLSLAKDDNSEWVNHDVTITATPSDEGSGIASVKYTVTDDKGNVIIDNAIVNDNKIVLQADNKEFKNKILTVKVVAYDNAGLKSEEKTQTVKFDTKLPQAEVTLKPNDKKEYYFSNNVVVGIKTSDNDLSGIKTIKALYLTDDVTGVEGWKIDNINWNDEKVQNISAYAENITIPFADTVYAGNVYVQVTDNAGNTKIVSLSKDKKFYFDNSAPTVNISYSADGDDSAAQTKAGVEYYNHDRYATITVTDASFDETDTKINVSVDGKEAVNVLDDGVKIDGVSIVQTDGKIWSVNKENSSYTAKIYFEGNHLYNMDVVSKDRAENQSKGYMVDGNKSNNFYIDKLAPIGKIQFSTDGTSNGILGNWWDKIINPATTLSIFKQQQLDIVGSVSDKTTGESGIWAVQYYVSQNADILSESDLDKLSTGRWKNINIKKSDNDEYSFSEPIDKSYDKYIVYLKITDNSGNVKYISTEGTIIDDKAPLINSVNIVDSYNQEKILDDESVDLWNQANVCLRLNVTDNLSGIDRYEYKLAKVNEDGTYSELSYINTVNLKEPECGTLNYITVFDILKSNAYAVDIKELKVTITVYDRAGNYSAVDKVIKIDTQAPTVTITRDDASSSSNNDKGWNNDTLTYTVVAEDTTSGIKVENEKPIINYKILIDGKEKETGKVNIVSMEQNPNTNAYTKVIGTIVISKDANYDSNNLEINVDTIDVAGNKSVSSSDAQVTAKYDYTAPTAKLELLEGVAANAWFSKDVTLKVTAQDNTSGIKKVEYTIQKADGTYVKGSADKCETLLDEEAEGSTKEYSEYISIPDSADYDTKELTITTYTYDYAGNCTTCTQKIKFDTTDPEASLSVDTSNMNEDSWFNNEVKFDVTAADAISGINHVDYVVKTSEKATAELKTDSLSTTNNTLTESEDGKLTGTITIPDEAKYDSRTLYVETTTYDNAGNTTTCKQTIQFDTTNPTANISLSSDMKKTLGSDYNVAKYYFNSDVKLDVTANDKTSGIKSIKYYATADGNVPTEQTWADKGESIFSNKEDMVGTKADFETTIDIPANFPNSIGDLGAINVYVQVIDSADNVTVVSLIDESENKDQTFRIDTTKPQINVEYAAEKDAYSVVDGVEYYNAERTATVSVKENSVFFDKRLVKILVSEDGGKEVDINSAKELPGGIEFNSNGWKNNVDDRTVNSVEIRFNADHKYTIRVEAQDLAENKADGYEINKSNTFIIDTQNPTGSMKYNYLSQGADTTWTSFVDWKNILNGGKYEISRFSKGNMFVSGIVKDEFSGVKEVSYNISNKDGVFADVSGITAWTPMESTGRDGSYAINLPTNNMNYVVYLKIVDYSGNVSYVSTNGAVLDTQAPKINVTLPTDINGIYASNVNVGVSVSDEASTGVVSGIKNVSYKVTSLGQQTQAGDLYTYTATAGSLDDLTKSVSRNFTVDAGLNNSNDVQIEVTAVDNAGNTYKTTNVIKIDITAPTIEVSYDNNSGDTSFGDNTYFKDGRTATVRVTERNFDPAKVVPVIEASAGGVPLISGWTTVGGTGNGDDTVNIATIYYGNDADYTFNISAEDIAGNKSGEVNYGNSLAPTKFTVDKTVPVISVAYDNNNAAEAGFYKEQRTATVTIQEHNFETSRVVLTMNATDNGNAVSAPSISVWSDSGDTHTATISFATDAVYTWTLAYTDKAGNQATDLESQNFCVDLTKPAITISGINPNSANNTEGNIGFAIECTDTNFGTFTPVLTAVVYENGSFVKKEVEGSASSVGNGERVEYGNLEEDGMYSLKCSAVDKAGNAYDTVNIVDEDGVSTSVNLQDGDDLIDFSVNRNGSTFALNDYSMDVVNNYYVQETSEDIVFYETNADELLSYNVKLNGENLEEGKDYTVSETGGNDSWYRYEYAVNKSLFDNEGEYNIVVESEDKATSAAYSDLKNVSADFVIDQTAPTFTISGIEEDGNYRGTSQDVTLVPTDDGGKLGHVKVSILDKDGNEQETVSDLSGDELTEYLSNNDGKIKFKVPEGVNQQVAILCADCSIGTDGGTNTYNYVYKGITVSSNAFILFFENKPLFYGTLGVIVVAILALTGIIIYKKRRKKQKEAQNQ